MDKAPNRIRELRNEAGLSQQAVADAIGVSKVTISDLERGKMRLDTDYMRRIAQALGVQSADLLSRQDNPYALTAQERALIDQLRAASDDQRDQVRKVADVIVPWKGPEDERDEAAA
ncbi:helix-turn-helix domain-containing protein [Aurantiacibacter zhengii]|uniref:Helix-turn-helix domain-containing protein n=1 Tax=Aurantiacibacter zhengii TaxID=2307003 RepID=A0A418NU71_9SPHN|nr:helix-turn-helix transcriptional regulator [Aurantiacibacter zhengii]RIV87480.1 helix-turn-helix domain-containing protein [Aurantiacibacter zhengii]